MLTIAQLIESIRRAYGYGLQLTPFKELKTISYEHAEGQVRFALASLSIMLELITFLILIEILHRFSSAFQ